MILHVPWGGSPALSEMSGNLLNYRVCTKRIPLVHGDPVYTRHPNQILLIICHTKSLLRNLPDA